MMILIQISAASAESVEAVLKKKKARENALLQRVMEVENSVDPALLGMIRMSLRTAVGNAVRFGYTCRRLIDLFLSAGTNSYTEKGEDPVRLYDKDNSGSLDFGEFRSTVRKAGQITSAMIPVQFSPIFRLAFD